MLRTACFPLLAQIDCISIQLKTPVKIDPRTGTAQRHHLGDQGIQRAFKQTLARAGIPKLATPHTS